jgi:hypothetical protein
MTTLKIERYRGDTVPDKYIMVDENDAVLDISTGYAFRLTVSSEQNPINTDNQLYEVVGVVTDGPAGAVDFSPSPVQADQEPGTYFYDVEVTYPSGSVKTIEKGKYIYKQDIGK